ncbi:MAG TPA: RDD family protein [Candidatus Solibacter sp.]|nr:RDD family protein [Candidatus Solibacter sp.]
MSRRLEQYRARRGYARPDDSQSGLPFQQAAAVADLELEEGGLEPIERLRPQRQAPRHRAHERVDICIQPELNFSSSPEDRARPQTALVPVASLGDRRWAGVMDGLFLALSCAGFAGLFHSLGGRLTLTKIDIIVYLSVAYLFYALYFSLFTLLAGSTPGMQLAGLTAVRLDGSLPDSRQLLWRNFGYLLSGATLLLGFVWAMWDEDHFTWQDRMSQTYITAAVPLTGLEPLEAQAAVGYHRNR